MAISPGWAIWNRKALILTLGKTSLTGQLITPKGSYQLEQQGQCYWLINSEAAGLKEMPLHNDALIPPASVAPEKPRQ